MLNIPDSIKALFNRDECRKNFRVHFPNGEHADLTNSDIVRESVIFSESVCTQNILRFGLTEGSSIEFETVGIPNIMGMTIECSCEVDTSSLTYAEILSIWQLQRIYDGEIVLDGDSDLEYGFFRIHYGVFRVESCPRNHGAMTHRKVTAYTVIGQMNPFEDQKLALPLLGNTYKPSAYALADSLMGYRDKNYLTDRGYSGTSLPFDGSRSYTLSASYYTYSHGRITISARIDYDYVDELPNISSLYKIDFGQNSYSGVIDGVIQYLQAADVNPASGDYTWDELAFQLIGNEYLPSVGYMVETWDGQQRSVGSVYFAESNYSFYPLRNFDGGTVECYMRVPKKITLTGGVESSVVLDVFGIQLAKYQKAAPTPSLDLLFTSAEDVQIPNDFAPQQTITGSSFAGAFTASEFLNAFLELNASYGRPTRSGGYTVMRLDATSPVSISSGQYKEMWWDEYDVEPIGTVRYGFTDAAGETRLVDFRFSSAGRSVYDMSDNLVLHSLQWQSSTSIEWILSQLFIPHLGGLPFTPIDLSMRGFPYLEAGDAISVTAEDGTVVKSYILAQELSGIQILTADVSSRSTGEFLEEGTIWA